MAALRLTTPRVLVLQALLKDPALERYGLDLAHHAGLEPGTIYPILVAFETAGWLRSRDEDIDVHAEGRPRRRYYQLTPAGVTAAQESLARAARRSKSRPATEKLAW
ncbi:PadR family transcriptional regulator [Actinoplanes derwentensis]|uniref:Transcriptional regulator PadR-like family protein n=1 Tax=Actinoplanes derwentensis TaxID=113562 RepID=A0A1H2CWR6_9ACTN|nr:helix-turn-helix transcriptional regulator [Actinoplanes derwentensis]GID88343.1 hypothetical protein Ade03nite_72670 [Actinoplanes derwentensis]SDT74652.1 Transcriptional regulator PadR-like family protein [Actinoplanes derwentensis]